MLFLVGAIAIPPKRQFLPKLLFLVIHVNLRSFSLYYVICSHMKDLVKGCDILFHELSYGPCLLDISRDTINSPEYQDKQLTEELLADSSNVAKWEKIEASAQRWKHSTAEMVGKYATEVEAKRVVLVHIGSRYEVRNRDKASRIEGMLRKRVKEYYNGFIILAYDGLEVFLNEQ